MTDTQIEPAGARYRAIARTLLDRIRAGEYEVGRPLPREVDLSVEFGVSRATVREALRLIESERAIIRRRRAGTIVSGLDPVGPRRLSFDLPFSLEELTSETRLDLFARDRRKVPDGLVDDAPLDGASWLYFAGIRRSRAADAPMSMTEIYLHPRLTAVAHLIGARRGLIYRLIEQECGERIRQVRTRMQPSQVAGQDAERLLVAAGSLATRMVQRIFNAEGELVEVAVGTYPQSRFVFDTSFTVP